MNTNGVSGTQWTVIGLLVLLVVLELLFNGSGGTTRFLAVFENLGGNVPAQSPAPGTKSQYGTNVSTNGTNVSNGEVPDNLYGAKKPERSWLWNIIDPYGNLKAIQ